MYCGRREKLFEALDQPPRRSAHWLVLDREPAGREKWPVLGPESRSAHWLVLGRATVRAGIFGPFPDRCPARDAALGVMQRVER